MAPKFLCGGSWMAKVSSSGSCEGDSSGDSKEHGGRKSHVSIWVLEAIARVEAIAMYPSRCVYLGRPPSPLAPGVDGSVLRRETRGGRRHAVSVSLTSSLRQLPAAVVSCLLAPRDVDQWGSNHRTLGIFHRTSDGPLLGCDELLTDRFVGSIPGSYGRCSGQFVLFFLFRIAFVEVT